VVTITIWTRVEPDLGPRGPVATRRERIDTLGQSGPMVAIVGASIGGIYLGLFTPVEAAAVGAFLCLAYALYRRSLGGGALATVLLDTVKTTAFVFLILIGAFVFGPFLAVSGLPDQIAQSIAGLQVPRVVILSILIVIYIVLGTFLEGFSILVLTLPIVIPIIEALHYDLIWFGVLMVILLEMGLISPPVGINVFVVKGLVPDVPMGQIFKGILPFWVAMGLCIVLIVAFPEIALIIPNTMIR
jgi:tripartite ATP-independent transporter DctM subunit